MIPMNHSMKGHQRVQPSSSNFVGPGTSKTLLVAGLLFLASFGATDAGTLSIRDIANGATPAATDLNSGISLGIQYTHLADLLSDDGGAVINGVTFPAAVNSGPGGGTVGTFSLSAGLTFQNFNSPATDGSGLDDLMDDFYHSGGVNGGVASLTLSGLTPGITYRLRLYVGGFGGNTTVFSADDTGTFQNFGPLARNGGDDSIARSFDYVYTLPSGDSNLVFTSTPTSANDSFHWYGFSNEVVPEPGSVVLFGVASGGLMLRRRRTR